MKKKPPSKSIARQLHEYPGFLIRRLQQVSIAIFLDRLQEFGITPLQYTILRIVENNPAIDQVSIAKESVLDASTTTDVIRRLEAKKLVRREAGHSDKRTKLVRLTPAGGRVLEKAAAQVHAAQAELLTPLSAAQRKSLTQMIHVLLDAHEMSRNGTDGVASPWRRTQKV